MDEATYRRGDGHDAAFLYPVPYYYYTPACVAVSGPFVPVGAACAIVSSSSAPCIDNGENQISNVVRSGCGQLLWRRVR